MSQSKVYVGNLPYNVTDEELQGFFGQYGDINEIKVITDRETGRSKGFGFITFASDQAAQAAIEADGKEFGGRALKVNIARENPRRGGGGGNGGGNRY